MTVGGHGSRIRGYLACLGADTRGYGSTSVSITASLCRSVIAGYVYFVCGSGHCAYTGLPKCSQRLLRPNRKLLGRGSMTLPPKAGLDTSALMC